MTKEKVKSLVRKLSKERKINAQILLRNYMLERFLERVAASQFNSCFILKGGLLITSMIGVNARSTMDLDATIKHIKLDEKVISEMIEDVISININDGVKMCFRKIETIRDEADYSGLRVIIDCSLDGLKQVLKIDLTTGDALTPGPIEYKYELLLEDRTINIYAYNVETVLAEKLETIVTRSLANTRMRDYYDVYILKKTRSKTIDLDKLKTAMKRTAKVRGTTKYFDDLSMVIKSIKSSLELKQRWEKYQSAFDYAKDITYEMTIESIEEFLTS